MTKNEQWGLPHIDTRDWSTYNERLVKRGEFYLSLDFIGCWDRDLAALNAGKQGRPFQYQYLANFVRRTDVPLIIDIRVE